MTLARSLTVTALCGPVFTSGSMRVSRVLRGGFAIALLAGVTMTSAAPTAVAQDMGAAIERLERLERDIRTLQQQVYRSTVAPSGQAAAQPAPGVDLTGDAAVRLQSKINELERLLTNLTGTVEENQYQVQRLGDRVNQVVTDMDFRLNRLEQQAGLTMMGEAQPDGTPGAPVTGSEEQAAGSTQQTGASTAPGVLGYLPQSEADAAQAGAAQPRQLSTVPTAVAGSQVQTQTQTAATPAAATAPLPEGQPDQQYDYAFGLLRKADYPAAEAALKAFLEQNPEHQLAGNAKYWLGETYYVRGEYQRAAVSFLEGYQQYPNSSKGPDNLLKLGLTMANLDKKKEACAAFERIVGEYPQASNDIKRRAGAERDRLNCG